MLGVYESMKKLIDKCDLYFEGHIISKELLVKNYADFLACNFEKKHNVAISLHTGSICFDIITVLFTAVSNIIYNHDNTEDFIDSLEIGETVQYKKKMYVFEGFAEPFKLANGKLMRYIKLSSYRMERGNRCNDTDMVPETMWNLVKPYHGEAKKPGITVAKQDGLKRSEFLSSVFEMDPDEIPAFIEKSSVIVMSKERSVRIVENIEIGFRCNSKKIKITEIMPVSYCSENEEYPFGGNPGKIEPAIKITNNISTARSIVTGNWPGNDWWENDIVGVSVMGNETISRAQTEVSEMMKRRKLKYVFVSYNISSEGGEFLLDEVEDASVFACTTEYLLNASAPVVASNSFTEELDKQVESVVNHKTIALPVKTFDCDWNMYKKVQKALSHLRHSGYQEAEEFVPLAHYVINLMITSVFPFQTMESLVESETIDVESPLQRIVRLTEIASSFSGEFEIAVKAILNFLEDGYIKLLEHSPKKDVLFDLVSKYCDKKVAIIVPKAYYANILYNLDILNCFEDSSQLVISTANNFDYSQQYDVIIAIGAFWGQKFDPFRCRAASTIYVIVSAVEENLFIYRKRVAASIEKKFNVFAKVPCDYTDETPEGYLDSATEEDVVEVVNYGTDVTDYINRIFETRSLEMLSAGTGSYQGTTEISYIATCTDGERIFFTKKYKAFVFDSAKEDVVEVSVDKLSPGDSVIFKSNNSETKDIVTALLDKYIDEYRTTSEDIQMAYLKARYWKEVLKEYRSRNKISYKELAKHLELHGSKKHEVTIQSWLSEDSYIVGPQDNETYAAIAKMTKDADMLADPKSFCRACERIRSVRIGILKLIAKTIINKYSGKLSDESDLAKVVSENIDDISVLVQIETITPVDEKKAPINMVNRPIAMN